MTTPRDSRPTSNPPVAAAAYAESPPHKSPTTARLFVWRAVFLLAAVACFAVALTTFVITKAGALELPAWLRFAAVPVALISGGLAFQLVRRVRRSLVARTGSVAEYDDSKPFVLY